MDFTDVGLAGDIPPGTSAGFEVQGQSIAVFNHAGTHYAVQNRCPHQGVALVGCPILKNGRVRCMVHGWLFQLNGCEEDDDLKRYSVRVEDGRLLIAKAPCPADQTA